MPTQADFIAGPLKDHGVTVVRTPNTVTDDNLTGDRQDSFGTPNNISIVFENPNIAHGVIQPGELENSEVKVFVAGDVTVNHNDLITWNTLVFRVESVSPKYFGANLIHKTIILSLRTP